MKTFAVKNKNEEVRLESRSGGIFMALSDDVLSIGGVVYGCKLDSDFNAIHGRATTKEERNAFRGSKYVQSKKNGIFQEVLNDLRWGKTVLFSGTPCENAGLRSFLRQANTDNLLCVDIVCHGVPSPAVWQSFLKHVSKQRGGTIENINFRNKKKFGWNTHFETITINGKEYDSNDYASIFYSHKSLRPSCYHCPYKSIERITDISIADCWGISKNRPDFDDNKGVSLVLINTVKGETFFNAVKKEIQSVECHIQDYMQPPLMRPCKEPKDRKIFWQMYLNAPFSKVIDKYGSNSKDEKLKHLVRLLFPGSMVDILKKIFRK